MNSNSFEYIKFHNLIYINFHFNTAVYSNPKRVLGTARDAHLRATSSG